MKKSLLLLTCFLWIHHVHAIDIKSLNESGKSISYDEVIIFYKQLDEKYKTAKLFTEGLTDLGRPLHVFVISSDQIFDPVEARNKGKIIILINNGIHPGEPDGIDASARLAEEYLSGNKSIPSNTILCIIPVYNVDGSLKRGCCSRANQDGPDEYGFRGNARNLDLNRDFIKCDSENAMSFTKIFRAWDPDVFVDTHVSNGSDYQYTLTLISTQHNKLGGPVGEYIKKQMTPALFNLMKEQGQEMSPYVNTSKYDESPESGIYGFMESPRFGTGYSALFHSLGFVTETHMLKPFAERVEATITFLEVIVSYSSKNSEQIQLARKLSKEAIKTQKEFTLNWNLDSSQFDIFPFKGYEAMHKTSKVTGLEQLYYDRSQPYTRDIKFFDVYTPSLSVKKPDFYIVPQAWKEVVDRMQLNGVSMTQLNNDTTMQMETYVISDFKSGTNPYEGHYLHHSVTFSTETKKVSYHKGDYKIIVNQECNRYIVETLEPNAPDSWFAWGFFDAILQQKEWFSGYVFEPLAEQILKENDSLRAEFENKKATEKEFAASSFSQLYFIYKNSKYFEDFRRYPVGRGRFSDQ